jgi:hypothetical protein
VVSKLPRDLDDDYCINVQIKRKQIHKSSHLFGLVNKRTIKAWLQYLIQTPLYQTYGIKIDNSFFDNDTVENLQLQKLQNNKFCFGVKINIWQLLLVKQKFEKVNLEYLEIVHELRNL